MAHIVVLSGAGISAESGLPTFRDVGGLWKQYSVHDLASPGGWERNPQLVLEFYNTRRQQAREAQPNAAHMALAELETQHRVTVITQNIDNLHERAGSTHVVHLHGEIMKARSSVDEGYLVDLDDRDIALGDLCPQGKQMRPHVVWFGEMVPMLEAAADILATADALLVVGTSLQVYPAAGLVDCAPASCSITVIDPGEHVKVKGATIIRKTACAGVPEWIASLKL
ncbi:Sir2 family NAD-dependent protein deacetylase [Hahella aquimaris]|uniref:SIR2 family NAD-dependent protein deacylase n=1 Tax=Hahella sp. HNIBRBA332 TaxID=3015983 RepID=UPI00273C0579|nr:Sir2 family NAD-dependent protein deacetylase [Hahella sp. HNIBRBA332]WLQ12958.1 Sir2 family NAD-dependent protein deacetylase [Hahella sp. HNIBRBA332]